MANAYNQGFNAALRGNSKSDNPYTGNDAAQWADGFRKGVKESLNRTATRARRLLGSEGGW